MTDKETAARARKHLSRYVQILLRCYEDSCAAYKNYGGKGITMCNEWLHSPDAFIEWCENNGYEEGLVLDKDILSDKLGISPRIYSPETCQFITQEENMQYVLDTTIYNPVACYDNKGNLVKSFKSVTQAEKTLGINNVGRAVSGKRLTAGNYYWRYIESVSDAPKTIKLPTLKPRGNPLAEVDENGNILATYQNAVEAAEKTGLKSSSISQVVSGTRPSLFGRFFKKL